MRVLLVLFALVNVPAVLCWGPIGHQVTAAVGQALLNTAATNGVNSVLAGDTLESVATWADQVKHTSGYEWSGVLHYINTPDWACNYSPTRDCGDKRCVSGAIYNYTQRLASSSISSTQRNEALKFLTHFAGDIHQPLHVGFTTDEGGNSIKGSYEGSSDNLHNIWDTDMIQTHLNNDFGGDQNQYVQYLVSNIQGSWSGNATIWASCGSSPSPYACPDSWASESVVLACTHAYVDQTGAHIQSGFSLGDPYYQFNVGVIDMQLAKGGVRLAAALNKIFASDADVALESNLDQLDAAIMDAFDSLLPSN